MNSASSSLNAKLGGPSCGDPYEILGLERSASTAEVQTKSRKLLLKCHPDKRRNDADHAALDKLFHDVQQAKTFLLDESKRRKYDAAWEADKERYSRLDAKRRKNLSDFEANLERAAKEKEMRKRPLHQKYNKNKRNEKDEHINNLKKENEKWRQNLYEEVSREQNRYETEKRASKKSRTDQSHLHQVRLKWSRKKLGTSFLEHDLVQYLKSKFPSVEIKNVELLGNKGNAALVTLNNPSDCDTLILGLINCNEMRAIKLDEQHNNEEMKNVDEKSSFTKSETSEEIMLRRAAEREILLRHMERGDSDASPYDSNKTKTFSSAFPPRFPVQTNNNETILEPLQRLQNEEERILKLYLSRHVIQEIQITNN